jgi:uncharacterized protein (TIGR02246 family)
MKTTSIGMKFFTVLATLAVCAFAFSVGGTTNPGTADEAIRENVKEMEAGWNSKQGALFAKPFAEDADFVVVNGMYFKGRAAIQKSHQQIFDTIFKNTTIHLSIKQVRFLRPDVAVVHVNGHRDAPENEKKLVADALMTMVMTREKEGWKIAAFQNTEVVASQPR